MKISKFVKLVKGTGRCIVADVAGDGIWLGNGHAPEQETGYGNKVEQRTPKGLEQVSYKIETCSILLAGQKQKGGQEHGPGHESAHGMDKDTCPEASMAGRARPRKRARQELKKTRGMGSAWVAPQYVP